jgi:hypothetical protein
MFKLVMTILTAVVAIGWIAYLAWWVVTHLSERKRPKRTTQYLQKKRDSFDNYAKKLQNFEKEPYKRR